ncbi:MAG: polymer-forming cytoskeletal protein [Acidobacteria bacterium]|nr:polymer-forming cytoskeletal protein [Acidobacteriota bacterium]
MSRPQAPAYSQVGRGASWSGRVSGSGMLIVLGEAATDLALQGEVVVGPAGRLTAAAGRCTALRVEGQARGSYRVDGSVAVAPGGVLSGAVAARRFDAARAAHLDGRLEIGVLKPDSR